MAVARRGERRKLGLALAYGGMVGGVYEAGAFRASKESMGELDLNQLDVHVFRRLR